MSAISGYISTIQNAVYGEQVRGAIINALEQCYSDVESPSLNQAAFTAAINAAYAGGILDIVTVTQISQMTNQQIIYRYNGTETGKQKGLYYYSALSSSWVLIGSEIHSVSNSNQMTDTNAIYKYTGTQSGMIQNSLYCYNGTAWIPIGSGMLPASTKSAMTNEDALYKLTGSATGEFTNAVYSHDGVDFAPINQMINARNGTNNMYWYKRPQVMTDVGGIVASTGEGGDSTAFKATNYFEVFPQEHDYLLCPFDSAINSDGTPSVYGIAFYDGSKSYISGIAFPYGKRSEDAPLEGYRFISIPSTAKFARLSVRSGQDYDSIVIAGVKNWTYAKYNSNYEMKDLSFGRVNIMNRAKQLATVGWKTTAANMPFSASVGSVNYYAKDRGLGGLPYTSCSVEDGYVGTMISLHTFMTAVHNPNSVLYNEVSKGYQGSTYYGVQCSGFALGALGFPVQMTCACIQKSPLFEKIEPAEVKVGDLWVYNGHSKIVTAVYRNIFGMITGVRYMESVAPLTVVNPTLSYSSFKNGTSGTVGADGNLYRYKYADTVDNYEPSQYNPLMNEPIVEPTYEDICTYYGDKVTRKYGTDIPIHVLSSSGYSSIEVYKDGTKIDTRSVANFTLTAPAVGEYKVRMIGTGKQSSTFFDIVDCSATKSGNNVTVTTTKKLLAIGGYPTYTVNSSGKATSYNNPKRLNMATKAEQTGKVMDISDILADNECNGGLRIYVSGKYGSVSWEYPWSYFE